MKEGLTPQDKILNRVNRLRAPEACSQDESWKKLQARTILLETPVREMPRRSRAVVWLAAASVAAVLVSLFFFKGTSAESLVAQGTTEVALPDGSTVWLTDGSRMEWSTDFASERQLELSGEAYFEVKHGSTFSVNTAKGKVSVLGTSFTVYEGNEELHVDCYTGKVQVAVGSGKATLTAGKGVKSRGLGLTDVFEHSQAKPSWLMEGQLEYTNTRLDRVLKHLMQRYAVEVRYHKEIAGKEFSGSFEDRGAEASLRLVAAAMGLELEARSEGVFELRAVTLP